MTFQKCSNWIRIRMDPLHFGLPDPFEAKKVKIMKKIQQKSQAYRIKKIYMKKNVIILI